MSGGFYKIGTLAKLSGFGIAAIRNWERRYHLLVPHRTEGGHRLYTETDRATLQRVRELLDAGRSIGEIAALARNAFPDESPVPVSSSPVLDGTLAQCVLDAVPYGIVVTGAEGKTAWINQAVTDLCGYTLADLVGRTPGSVLQGPATDQRAVQRLREAIGARHTCSEQLMNYDSRNRAYLAAIDIAPLWAGKRFRGFVGLIRDLTRRQGRTNC